MKKQIYPKGQDQESPRVRQDDLPFFLPEVTVTTSPMASEPEQRFRRCLERITRGLVAFLDIAATWAKIIGDYRDAPEDKAAGAADSIPSTPASGIFA